MADTSTTAQKVAAEVLGTFVLVFFGCATTIVSGRDYVSIALAFGLSVLVMTYAFGRVSGAHFNPAVSVGAAMGGRMAWRQVPVYVGAQLVGAVVAGGAVFVVLHGFEGFDATGSMGQNFFGDQNPLGHYAVWAAFVLELVLTAIFLLVILAVTDARNEHPSLAPLTIGLAFAAIYFVAIPATGASANPARSIGPALFAGTDAIIQLWLFILAPLLGGAIAGLVYPMVFGRGTDPVPGSGLSFRRTAPAEQAWTVEQAAAQGWQWDPATQQWHQIAPQGWQPQAPAPQPWQPQQPQQQWPDAGEGDGRTQIRPPDGR